MLVRSVATKSTLHPRGSALQSGTGIEEHGPIKHLQLPRLALAGAVALIGVVGGS
jgi:hypothetical protein